MHWITATDLNQWADKKSCEALFPLLIQKLIDASCPTYAKLDSPSVRRQHFKPGWDISCSVIISTPFLPAGELLWELGKSKNYRTKLNSDFKKRTNQTTQEDQEKHIFIFVTPQRWVKPEKQSVISELKKASSWKDILIYDADNLENWLNQFPAVARWLAVELGIPKKGIITATEFWDNFSKYTQPHFSAQLVICERFSQHQKIIDFIRGDPGILELQASSTNSGAAFVIASMLIGNEKLQYKLQNNTIVVTKTDQLRNITALRKGLLVIYISGDQILFEDRLFGENHVITVLNLTQVASRNTVQLPLPMRAQFAEQLYKLGIKSQDTFTLASKCGKSLSVLRRILAEKAGRVSWIGRNDITELIPIFSLI